MSAIAHERLSIVDPDSGEQPLFSKDGTVSLAANGGIYNHKDLKAGPLAGAYFSTGSDCEVMIPLYERFGPCAEMVGLPYCYCIRAMGARSPDVARAFARRWITSTGSSLSSSWTRRTVRSWRHVTRSA